MKSGKNYITLCLLCYCFFPSSCFNCSDGSGFVNDNDLCSSFPRCNDCSDANSCNNSAGLYRSCNAAPDSIFKCVLSDQFCDGMQDCESCHDEKNCPDSNLFFCEDDEGCIEFQALNCKPDDPQICQGFCNGIDNCADMSDERSTGFGFKCATVNQGNECVVAQLYLERYIARPEVTICENGADKCFEMKGNEKVFDTSACWTCLEGTIIQRQQVCNGVFDCPDLSDECLCFRDNTNNNKICEQLLNSTCDENEFPCPNENLCVKISKICDGQNDCRNGTDENYCNNTCASPDQNFQCQGTELPKFSTAVPCDGKVECPSADDECKSNCTIRPNYCDHIRLDDVFDCNDSDNENDSTKIRIEQLCDLFFDCPNGIDEHPDNCPNFNQCDNGTSFDIRPCGPDRCNLEAKCENIADELNCSSRTHFYCDNYTKFVPQWLRFDGHPDCDDFTDECAFDGTSVSSTTELVKYEIFKVFLWIFMLLALLGNTVVITKTSMELKYSLLRRSHSSINRVGLCNKIMILNLALSDFLMGIYLFIIVVKSLQFAGIYCKERVRWLQGNECAFAGVLAVISSQASILLMVLMTTYRLYGVANPFRAEKIKGRMICAACFCIWILALFLGIIPLFPGLSLTFASSVNIYQPYGPNLISFSDFSKLFKYASKLPGLKNIPPPDNLTINTFCSLFSNGNSQPTYCEQIDAASTANLTGYYGTNGVCLPRYYSSTEDPVSGFTLGIICLNFAAFLYMFIAYVYIYKTTSFELQQGDSDCGSMDDVRLKENRALWSKIVRLIVTDFLCWIPICVMSFMSFAGVVLPNFVYPFTALVLVPINGSTNPWLYSSFLTDYVKNQWDSNQFKEFCLRKNSTVHSTDAITDYTQPKTRKRLRLEQRRFSEDPQTTITLTSRMSVTGVSHGDNGTTVVTTANL